MFINKDNLTIRSARIEDAEILTRWWNDGTVMAHAGFPNGLDQSIEVTISQVEVNKIRLSQICIIEIDKIPVGEMSFGFQKDGIAEIGIKICIPTYQNRGYGSKLTEMLINYLFDDAELNQKFMVKKIILDTNLKNQRAQHVYEKLGFTPMGVNYRAWKDQQDQWQDTVDYEMTRESYKELKKQSLYKVSF